MAKQTDTDNSTVIQDFKDVVNMSAKELETWLKTA
jgi:hypothetical protein